MNEWNADIIRDKSTNEYRAIFSFADGPEIEVCGNCWRELSEGLRLLAGIRLPLRKHFKFERLSDFEEIAGVDASHTRESCIVTMKDRKSGWHRWTF